MNRESPMADGCQSAMTKDCPNEPQELHPCPHAEDIEDNFNDVCTCCKVCTEMCADEN